VIRIVSSVIEQSIRMYISDLYEDELEISIKVSVFIQKSSSGLYYLFYYSTHTLHYRW
jgi:hypothetical protein